MSLFSAGSYKHLAKQALPLLIALMLFGVACYSAERADVAHIDSYGLFNALPASWYVALGLMLLVYAATCCRGTQPSWSVYAQLALLVTALTSAPILAETLPRFSSAWIHAGLAERLQRTGEIIPAFDARYSWPGFFAATAMLAEVIGVQPLALVRWAPLALQLSYLPPMILLMRWFLPRQQQQAIALVLFTLGNWVGQDYFSPQGTNYALFLTFATVLLYTFSSQPSPQSPIVRLLGKLTGRRYGWIEARRGVHSAVTPYQAGGATLLLVLLYTASVVSHQLTPFFMLLIVVVLVSLAVCRLRSFPLLLALISLSYITWGAQDFWQGHLHDLLGQVGHLRGSLQQNFETRLSTGSVPNHQRQVVLGSRVAMALIIYALAIVGMFRNRCYSMLTPAALALCPFVVLLLQSYGGEALLRIYLFSLPFSVVLASCALGTQDRVQVTRLHWPSIVSTWVVSVSLVTVLLPGFVLARFGNESFEEMRVSDREAVVKLYSIAPRGSTLYSLDSSVPWREVRIDSLTFLVLDRPGAWVTGDFKHLLTTLARARRPVYLLITEGQLEAISEQEHVPMERMLSFEAHLDTLPMFEVLYANDSLRIYRYIG